MSVDVAVEVLHGLLRDHRVPASRIARDERGLTWWGPHLVQRFTVSGPALTSAGRTWWLSFETDFLAGFEPGSRAQLATATMLGWSFELFTAGIESDKVVLRGRTYALEAEQGRGLAERAADLGRRALVASHVAHTHVRWYLDGTLRLPEAGVRVDATVQRGPGAEATTENLPTAPSRTEHLPTEDLPDPTPAPGAILTVDDLDLTPVTTLLTDRGMTPLDAPSGKLAFGVRLPSSQRDVVILLDTTAMQPHAGQGLSVLFSPVGLANDRSVASAAEINAAAWSISEPPVGMGTWSGRRGIGLSYADFLPYRWTTPTALIGIFEDDLGHVLQADRNGWVAPR
ncbi:MAG: hypothetical protein R6W77_13485 [Trueperaceae bacterium]